MADYTPEIDAALDRAMGSDGLDSRAQLREAIANWVDIVECYNGGHVGGHVVDDARAVVEDLLAQVPEGLRASVFWEMVTAVEALREEER